MGKLLPGMFSVVALVALVGAADARSAGTKPAVAVPVATESHDVTATVSRKKPDTSDDDIVTGLIKKPRARHLPKPDR